MGYVRRAQQQTNQLISRRPRKKGNASVQVNFEVTPAATDQLLAMFPQELRAKVLKQALRQAGRIVANKTKGNLAGRRSRITGTDELRSEEQQRFWEQNKDLYQSVTVKVKEYDTSVLAMVGFLYPAGRRAHLEEFTHMQPLWGKGAETSQGRPFLRPAADQTKSQQQRAVIDKLKKGVDQDMILPTAIRNLLLSDTDISTAVDGWRVFSDRPPQNASAPMLVFGVVSETTNDCLLGSVWAADQARLQIDCYGTTRTEADKLRQDVRGKLTGTREVVDGLYLRIVQDSGQSYTVDRTESGTDQYRFINTQDFQVTYHGEKYDSGPPPPSEDAPGVLATGYWDDLGRWRDDEPWKDSP